jgi:hypothetical protein
MKQTSAQGMIVVDRFGRDNMGMGIEAGVEEVERTVEEDA